MTVDLSTARVGSEVTTHAGAKLVIERCEPNEWGIKFWFSGYTGWFIYQPDGGMSHAPRPNPMDIIAISPPPMSDAERLVEIAKMLLDFTIMPDVGGTYFSIHATKWNVILALAKDRTP